MDDRITWGGVVCTNSVGDSLDRIRCKSSLRMMGEEEEEDDDAYTTIDDAASTATSSSIARNVMVLIYDERS